MATDFDRDDPIDEILKGARRQQAAAPAGPLCLDAETLAAWGEGHLVENRRLDVERHLADCPRCQAMMAAFVQSDAMEAASGATAPIPLTPRRSPLRYWLPLAGTIAASLLIWIGVRDRQPALQPSADAPAQVSAKDAETAAPVPQPQGGTVARDLTQQPPARKPLETGQDRRLDAIQPVEARRGAALKREAPASRRSPAPAAPTPVPVPTVVAQGPPPPAVALPPPAGMTVAGQQGTAARQAMSEVTFRAAVPVVIAQFSTSDARENALAAPAGGVIGGVAGTGRGGAGGTRTGGGGRAVTAVAAESLARAAPPAHWRILAGDVVQRSADAAAWETIAIDPPVTGLTGGAAPSPLVCWLIGRSGLVLLSIDGRSFARTTVPSAVDLVSIKAIDALRATVTTAQGQTFSTADGGKTWRND